MRGLSLILLLLIIGSLLFVGANIMRCNNAIVSPCPSLCFEKKTSCANDTTGECETKTVCRAPDSEQYFDISRQYLRELRYKLY